MEKITITTKDLVSVPQSAKELGVHFTTLYRWIRKGKILPFVIGSQVFITRATLDTLKNTGGGKCAEHNAEHG